MMEIPCSITRIIIIVFISSFFLIKSIAMPTYDVVELGAKPDGKTDSTPAFKSAWNSACGSSKPACISVPKGNFLLHEIQFQGPCKSKLVFFKIIGSIIAPDYKVMGKSNTWIMFQNVVGVSIEGGILDGQGSSLWDCKKSSKNCPDGATTLAFYSSSNIDITGLTSKNSEMFHIAFVDCQHVNVLRATVLAPGKSPNTDGIHVQFSTDISILHSFIGTGDDCISIGPGTKDLWIEDIDCAPGHGISIGSLGRSGTSEEGVKNVTVKTTRIKDTQNGVRIKTWATPCKSFVKDIVFQNAIMSNVENPIIIDQHYCTGIPHCPGEPSGVEINNVRYEDIHGTSATEIAMKFDCSDANPCSKIKLEDINLTYKGKPAKAYCSNASGKASGDVDPDSCLYEEKRKNNHRKITRNY